MSTQSVYDTTKAASFAERMMRVLNDACSALQLSIGHQTGLFDKMAPMAPSTSAEIARAAGLDERYVREWLGALTVARIVEYDPETSRYRLPAEHAASLTRAAGPKNLALIMQFIAMMGVVEPRVVQCFREGGGVPYSAFPRFHSLQKEETATIYDAALLERVLPIVPGLVERLREGIDAADFGCGSGHALNSLAKAFPRSRFAGFDFGAKAIEAAQREAAEMGLKNSRFEVRDLARLELSDAFDFIATFDVIHDLAKPARVLAGIARALRPGATYLMQDIAASSRLEENLDHPLGPALYTFSIMHCMTVSLAQGGAGLGTVWGEQTAKQMLADAGLKLVRVERVEGDPLNNYYVATRA